MATFFGRPPFLPLSRAAAVFASDFALPPLRPSATAAGFLRGVTTARQHVQGFHAVHGDRVVAVRGQHGWTDTAEHARQLAGFRDRQNDGPLSARVGRLSKCHVPNISRALGFVKW